MRAPTGSAENTFSLLFLKEVKRKVLSKQGKKPHSLLHDGSPTVRCTEFRFVISCVIKVKKMKFRAIVGLLEKVKWTHAGYIAEKKNTFFLFYSSKCILHHRHSQKNK
jgi:hypothetical protein